MKADPFAQLKLLDVQELDSRLDQLRHRLATLPQIAELKELARQRGEVDDRARDARILVDDLTREQKRADADVEQVKARRERDQAMIDAGSVADPKARRGGVDILQAAVVHRIRECAVAEAREDAADALLRIVHHMAQAGFSDKEQFAVRLSLEEGIVNAIKHGNKLDPKKTVRVEAKVTSKGTQITVEDQGQGIPAKDMEAVRGATLEIGEDRAGRTGQVNVGRLGAHRAQEACLVVGLGQHAQDQFQLVRAGGETRWVQWDHERFPYLARVTWDNPRAPPRPSRTRRAWSSRRTATASTPCRSR